MPKFAILSLSHDEQNFPTKTRLNELVCFCEVGRYPYCKRSPKPLIASALKNVFLQTATDLTTPSKLHLHYAWKEWLRQSFNDLLDKGDILSQYITEVPIKFPSRGFSVRAAWDCGQTVVEA